MNYIEQVAKMLGVEIGEEFEIEHSNEVYYFDKEGLRCKVVVNDIEYKDQTESVVLEYLLKGTYKIKVKWKPELGEKYWIVSFYAESGVNWYRWDNGSFDKRVLKNNNVFKTKEEAEKAFQAILKTLKELR